LHYEKPHNFFLIGLAFTSGLKAYFKQRIKKKLNNCIKKYRIYKNKMQNCCMPYFLKLKCRVGGKHLQNTVKDMIKTYITENNAYLYIWVDNYGS